MTPDDLATLDRLLGDEPDLAYRRRARALLEFLELEDGDRIFDCGCGMGFYLLAMGSLRRAQLVGLDLDARRLAQARDARVEAGLTSGEIEYLPFADASFDKVLMTEVLEHLDSDVAGLREVFRVLRPGGTLALSVPHARYPFLWDPIGRIWAALGGSPIRSGPIVGIWTGHQRLYTPEALVEVVRTADFEVELVREATHYCLPLSHFLLYGVGKPLLESGMLPASIRASANRMARNPSPSALRPIVRVLEAVDALNESPAITDKHTFVNVLLKARKPMS